MVSVYVMPNGEVADRTARCAGCGRQGTDAWLQWQRRGAEEPRLRYCRHCWGDAYAAHRAAYRAEVDAHIAQLVAWTRSRGRGPAPPAPQIELGATAAWIAGAGWLPRLARRLFP